jgi:hypothetical protein
MGKKIDAAVVQAVLFGIYKALYKITGASAASVMRQAAPDILLGLTEHLRLKAKGSASD